MKPRPNQCRFCTSRRCYCRIVSSDSDGSSSAFDEIACRAHVENLEDLADTTHKGYRWYISGTGLQRRREVHLSAKEMIERAERGLR